MPRTARASLLDSVIASQFLSIVAVSAESQEAARLNRWANQFFGGADEAPQPVVAVVRKRYNHCVEPFLKAVRMGKGAIQVALGAGVPTQPNRPNCEWSNPGKTIDLLRLEADWVDFANTSELTVVEPNFFKTQFTVSELPTVFAKTSGAIEWAVSEKEQFDKLQAQFLPTTVEALTQEQQVVQQVFDALRRKADFAGFHIVGLMRPVGEDCNLTRISNVEFDAESTNILLDIERVSTCSPGFHVGFAVVPKQFGKPVVIEDYSIASFGAVQAEELLVELDDGLRSSNWVVDSEQAVDRKISG